ncbi:MAG: recombinase family protein [Zoogloeaceae bacterium]|nr:recombinase family protein [Zoogloeaceae bacterium]
MRGDGINTGKIRLDRIGGFFALHDLGRVSTNDQDLTIQRAQLETTGCARVFAEKIIGTRAHRPELAKMRLFESIVRKAYNCAVFRLWPAPEPCHAGVV